MNKTCRTCKETKPESEFSIAASGKKGANFRHSKFRLKTQCKSCDAEYARNFRKNNKNYTGTGKINKFENRYLASAVSNRMTEAKSRSKKSGLPFDLDQEYLYNLYNLQNGVCIYTKEPLLLERENLASLSLDKIEPSLGYVKGNVQWVCWAVNRAKGEMT